MELDDLLTQDAHEEGAECQIISPVDNKPTDFYIKVLGTDSIGFQKAQRKIRNNAIKALSEKKEISIEDEIDQEIEHLASITIGWRGLTVDEKEKPFTKEHCKNLYTKAPHIRSQVDRFISDLTNFTKG